MCVGLCVWYGSICIHKSPIGSDGRWLFSYAPFLFSFLFWMHIEKGAILAVVYIFYGITRGHAQHGLNICEFAKGVEILAPGSLTKFSSFFERAQKRNEWLHVCVWVWSLSDWAKALSTGAYLPESSSVSPKRLKPLLERAAPLCMNLIF